MTRRLKMSKEKTPKEWLDKIQEEHNKGNVCFLTYEGLMAMPLKDFINQPADGILYDLNRLPEVVASWINGDKKWVNDYAVGMTIRYLKEQNDSLHEMLEVSEEALDYYRRYQDKDKQVSWKAKQALDKINKIKSGETT